MSGHLREGRIKIGQRDNSPFDAAALPSTPRHHQRNPMSAVVEIRLVTPIHIARIVSGRLHGLHSGAMETAVVGRKHDDGVLIQPRLLQQGNHLRNDIVHHQHEIAIGRKARFSAKLFRRQDRRMGSRQGHIEEKGLSGPLPGDELQRFAGDALQTLSVFEVGTLRALALQKDSLSFSRDPIGQGRNPVILHIYIRWHVQRSRDSEEVVESAGHGSLPDRSREIHPFPAHRPVPAQMPFADASGRIAPFGEASGDCPTVRGNQRRRIAVGHATLQGGAECVAARQDAVARRGAHRSGSMCIRKDDSRPTQRIDGRSMDPRMLIQGRDIPVAHVIGQNENHIRLSDSRQGRQRRGRSPKRAFVQTTHTFPFFKQDNGIFRTRQPSSSSNRRFGHFLMLFEP